MIASSAGFLNRLTCTKRWKNTGATVSTSRVSAYSSRNSARARSFGSVGYSAGFGCVRSR